ncbi:ABC transporter substrate-binding protein [Candidatus Venteria ishoeyi]|uniref:Alkanesulfonate transporter substrate-binding subunit n=1 Tax=Candidatus Venteria ishoeyi TaxID=1899563 RepID=A0A1H6F8V7_9GAMM|nr:ABC transporter substrate-binding protein [Candidatus Venteria ishoeyi]MDM8547193.1 ABC transporter substrate-binding protein [Candidatus Venteria ishoeyi]SEH06540.1 alkanesulfonate transporter substrate-binding subunit [Candidatus Venteria ishoeyi]
MIFYRKLSMIGRAFIIVLLTLTFSGCDMLEGIAIGTSTEEVTAQGDVAQLKLVVPKYLPWLPWFLAAKEDVFQQYSEEYHVDITFEEADYEGAINKFVSREADAVVVTNIDGISKIATRGIEVDVILISSYSQGNDALLIPAENDANLKNKNLALESGSTAHYLLDRYLLRNQIDFDEVSISNTSELDLIAAFDTPEIAGIVSWNPVTGELIEQKNAKVLFSSQEVPREISHLLIVHRETLDQHPNFARALLATWFTMMERLQGNRRGATLDAFASLTELNRETIEARFDAIEFTETPARALSVIRDRRMKKTMRHIRFFMGRHELANDAEVGTWVSYPGRTPDRFHFNAQPLQNFIAPPEVDEG